MSTLGERPRNEGEKAVACWCEASSGGKEVWRRGCAEPIEVTDIVEALRRFIDGGWTARSAAVEARFFVGGSWVLEGYGGDPAGEKL